jgi:small subunit ribosomal protein S4e
MTRRLKRRAAPRAWKIPRKGTKWVLRVAPGPHAQDASIPLLMVLRELRGYARTAREARTILREGSVKVDGTVVHDPARGVGLMDTVSFATSPDEHFRVLLDARGKLVLVSVPAAEATTKLGRVSRKTTVTGGKIQVTLHDGRNLLAPAKSAWRVGDSLTLSVPDQKVKGHLPLQPGALAYVAGGSHVGQLARVERIEVRNSPEPNRVHFTEGFSTIKKYVFVVGTDAPQITLRALRIIKIVVNAGVGESGEPRTKAERVLRMVTNQKPVATRSHATNRDWGIRQGQEIGAKVTLRGAAALEFLNRALDARDRQIDPDSIDRHGNISFGIADYTDFAGMKYDPAIGIHGMDICVEIGRAGWRLRERTRSSRALNRKVRVTKEDCRHYLETELRVKFLE